MKGLGVGLCLSLSSVAVGANEVGASTDQPREKVAYDPATDPFYRKKTIYATWIMIWNGSTERWWRPTDYHGCKVEIDGAWQATDWSNPRQIDAHCRSIRDAGINVIMVDLTNGFRWEWQAKQVQQFCHDNGMKFAVAFNPQGDKDMEKGCKRVWDVYAAATNPLVSSYLHLEGKPLAVLYTTRGGYKLARETDGPSRKQFSTAWASGEDSDKDKWGWQLEPEVGPVASDNTMFVTGSIKFESPRTTTEEWRRHLSWLDYGFISARANGPKFVVVGSFDDLRERNAWLIADTSQGPPGFQTRDASGAPSRDAYFNRVHEWIKGTPTVVKGGLIADGAYRVQSSAGSLLGTKEGRLPSAPATLLPKAETVDDLMWFYHLGDNVYRIIKLNAGLALEAKDNTAVLSMDSDEKSQRWIVSGNKDGFRFVNQANGNALSFSDDRAVTAPQAADAASQVWKILPVATVIEPAAEPARKR